jgi:hypothetical protein
MLSGSNAQDSQRIEIVNGEVDAKRQTKFGGYCGSMRGNEGHPIDVARLA